MNDLEQLKQILFGNEKKAIDAIVRRLETPESRTADVADVLPDAVTRSYHRDDRLGKALSVPVESTLSDAIRREPKKFADALFPVMGPAIRKAIAEALKSMLQSMNNAIDTSLSPSARFKAWRAGVPLAEWVFRQSLVYRVDEIYLVDPESGLLVSYLHHPDIEEKDEDAVSAMLTAIQDFVRDSFSKGLGGGLESAVLGEFTVWISQGPHAMLACVIRGVPPVDLKTEIAATNERIHLRYSQEILNFDGHAGSVPGLNNDLEELLRIEHVSQEEHAKKSLLSMPLLITLLGVLGLIGYFLFRGYALDNKITNFDARMQEAPGVFSTMLQRNGNRVQVKGLRDPLASDPVELAALAGISSDQLDHDFLPFQSLDPDVVVQRVRQVLQPPDTLSVRLVDSVLVLEGRAPAQWLEYVKTVAPAMGGVQSVDDSRLREDDASILQKVTAELEPPSTVEMAVTQGVLIVSGTADLFWHEQLNNIQAKVASVIDVNSDNLDTIEQQQIAMLEQQLQGRAVFFTAGSTLASDQAQTVRSTAALVRQYSTVLSNFDQVPSIEVVGHVDGVGDDLLNYELMQKRAIIFRDRLVAQGVNPEWLSIAIAEVPKESSPAPLMRKAELVLKNNSNN